MNKIVKNIILKIDDSIIRILVKILYPQYRRRRHGYMLNMHVLLRYGIPQKIFRINGDVPWPVDFRSKVNGWRQISKGICCDPGDNISVYINAGGGLVLGNNVNIGPGTSITTTNHKLSDHRLTSTKKGIVIGDNVWIGANCCILAGVKIGSNVTIGAGSVVSQDIPDNSIYIRSSESYRIREKLPYLWDCTKQELN